MDFDSNILIALITAVTGGGGLGGLVTWFTTKKQRETSNAIETQKLYQSMIEDCKNDRADKVVQIEELRQERNEYKGQLKTLEENVTKWKHESSMEREHMKTKIDTLNNKINGIIRFGCSKTDCMVREILQFSESGTVIINKKKVNPTKKEK